MKKSLVFFILILSFGCTQKIKKPKLIVLVSIDQMRGDYLSLFHSQMEYGLKELSENGVVYTNANHNHFNTTTAAGHATIATGCYPSNHGITGNTIYNRLTKRQQYSIEDTTVSFVGTDSIFLQKVSSNRLLKPSFGDRIKATHPETKYYSVALKDRSSILMGGKSANRAFWFNAATTTMVSTNHYTTPFPEWAKHFAANEVLAKELQEGWYLEKDFERLNTTSVDSVPQEKDRFYPTFPHTLTSFDTSKVNEYEAGAFFWNTPYGDQYVLEFAKQLIEKENLGQDEVVDVLTVGLSAADVIGHHFGPNSFEVLDYYNKVDRYLADFLTFLNKTIGKDNYVLVLTSDHGVVPFPELSEENQLDAKRISQSEFSLAINQIDNSLRMKFRLSKPTILKSSYKGLEPDFEYLHAKNIDSAAYLLQLSTALKKLPYIDETYDFFEINDSNCSKKYIEQVRNSHSDTEGYFVKILAKEFYLIDMRHHGTTHGTPYSYDTHVPLIWYGHQFKKKSIDQAVYTTDIATTILGLLNLQFEDAVDGKNLFSNSSSK